MLIMTQGLCNISFSSLSFSSYHFPMSIWDHILLMLPLFSSYPCHLTHSHRNAKTLYSLWKDYLNLLLEPRQDLVPDLQRHLSLYPYPIAQLRGVDTQVSSDDPVRKLEHWSHFSSFLSLWTLSLFYLSLHFPLCTA